MFTGAGVTELLQRLMESLEGGTLVVGNGEAEYDHGDTDLRGDQQASAPIEEMRIEVVEQDGDLSDMPPSHRLLLRATFGPQEANFEWRERGIRRKDGTLIDRTVEDQGRKAPGFSVTVEHMIDLDARL